MRILACNSPYGQGGIGQHFAQLVEETRAQDQLAAYYCLSPKEGDASGHRLQAPWWQHLVLSYTPVRFSPSWRSYLLNEIYDRLVARAIRPPADRFMGFAGKSLHTFRHARQIGIDTLELVAANSHVKNVKRLLDRAHEELGGGKGWLHDWEVEKTLQEYELADRIYVHSEYTRRTFEQAGVAPEKLIRTHLHVDARFTPPAQRPHDDVFRIVYVGRLDFGKGIPLLLEAFEALPYAPKELLIVGGWGTRHMRKYMESWLDKDDRITVAPGDPLPHLQRADVFVHPSYEDGFGYAPTEALACGVPVIVTEDTGMKEYVQEGVNGFIVPTGSREAILERLIDLSQHPLASTESLLPASAPTPDVL